MKHTLIIAAFAVLSTTLNAFSQSLETTNEVAKMEHKLSTVKNDESLYKLVFGSLPDLNACKSVFTGNHAYEYYDNVSKLKEALSKENRSIGGQNRSISEYNFVKLVPVTLEYIAEHTSVAYLKEAKNIVKTTMNPSVTYYKAYANKADHYKDLNDWIFVNVAGTWFTIVEPWKLEKGVEEIKKVDESALWKKSSGSGKGETVGDQGNPKGSIEAGSLYGKPGGSKSGLALNVAGWGMGARPQVNDDSDESGRIVFEITVDDTGDIINVKVKEADVSQSVVDVYKRAVSRMKLVPKSDNVPRTSKGTISFNIKSR